MFYIEEAETMCIEISQFGNFLVFRQNRNLTHLVLSSLGVTLQVQILYCQAHNVFTYKIFILVMMVQNSGGSDDNK